MAKYTYYTCQELADNHNNPVKMFRWNANKIGLFYNCLLLDGKSFGKNRIIISESSFKNLIAYAYDALSIIDTQPEYLSYDDVMELIPQAELYRWSPTVIGVFFHSALLCGKKSKEESRNLVTKQSVINLIQYTNKRFSDIANKPIH